MALAALSEDELLVIFEQLCNPLDPGIAVAFSSVSRQLRALTQAPRQQLRTDHQAATVLSRKARKRTCKELREAEQVELYRQGLSADELALLGSLGSVLSALERLHLMDPKAGTNSVPQLGEKLGAGALPAVYLLNLNTTPVGDAGASALANALGRGALPRLVSLQLGHTGIGDAGLAALAPALWQLRALNSLHLDNNPFGDEGFAALVSSLPGEANAPRMRGLATLAALSLCYTHIADASCAVLAKALDSVLPSLLRVHLNGIPASAAGRDKMLQVAFEHRLAVEWHEWWHDPVANNEEESPLPVD